MSDAEEVAGLDETYWKLPSDEEARAPIGAGLAHPAAGVHKPSTGA